MGGGEEIIRLTGPSAKNWVRQSTGKTRPMFAWIRDRIRSGWERFLQECRPRMAAAGSHSNHFPAQTTGPLLAGGGIWISLSKADRVGYSPDSDESETAVPIGRGGGPPDLGEL